MNKKNYMEPACEVVTLNIEAQLLAGSVVTLEIGDEVTEEGVWAD